MYQRDLKYIDIVIGKNCNHYRDAEFPGNYIQNIRIRFIKNTSQRCMITSEEERMYYEYSNWINEYCNGNSVNLSKINEKWFLAKGLLSLSFTNMDIFKIPGTCKDFAKNISKLESLAILEMNNCKIREIPSYVYYELPISLTCIMLENNYLQRISPLISRLKFLMEFSVANNRNLSDDGFPWNDLPTNLMTLELGQTNLTKIPIEVKKLQNLNILGIQIPSLKVCLNLEFMGFLNKKNKEFVLQEVEWDAITKGIFALSVSNPQILTNQKASYAQSLTLKNVGLSNLDEIVLPSYVRELRLPINDLTSWDINLEDKKFSHLTIIDLSHNMLTWLPWESLPSTLESIDITNNVLEEVGSLRMLKNLKDLFLQHNFITKIASTNVYIQKIKTVNLSHNYLEELPQGFEKMWNPKKLDLSYNKFTFKNPEINNVFWNRLPGVMSLDVSGNALMELPCKLAGNFWYIKAIDCKLQYICPQIYNINFEKEYKDKIYINISKNEDLKTLSFIPHIIHPVALANEKPNDEHLHFDDYEEQAAISTLDDEYVERSVIVSNTAHLRNTKNTARILHYTFNEVEENEFEKTSSCECCAYCNHEEADFHETVMIEQLVMAGWVLAVVDDDECRKEEAFKSEGWQAGKWKTLIRTRLCQICIQTLKTKSDTVNREFMEIKKELKKPRIELSTAGISDEKLASTNNEPLSTTEVDIEMALPDVQQQTEVAFAEINDDETENPHIQQIPEFTWILVPSWDL
uniref:Leucine-rich repeat protein n=1 Tax=Panagrolaimus davidi TaxID=227884 RepID=A0A914QI16_9BILA